MKRIISMLIAIMMVLSLFASPAFANEGIKVILDGAELQFDVPPQLINDRTMVPLRVIFEALGATVNWDDPTRTVTAIKGGTAIVMQIDNTTMFVNDKSLVLDVPPQLVDSRTLVPVRAVAEGFDAKVDWVDETQSVIITSKTQSVLGTVNNNIYENSFIGISFKLDNNWKFKSQEEMNTTAGIVESYIGEEYKSLIENATILYDMSATNMLNADTIAVNLEKCDNTVLNSISVEDIYNKAVPVIEQGYKNMGATDFDYEITTDKIKGKDVSALVVGIKISDITLYQIQISRKCDGYIANISFTATSAEGVVDLMDKLEWIN